MEEMKNKEEEEPQSRRDKENKHCLMKSLWIKLSISVLCILEFQDNLSRFSIYF